MHSLAAAGAGFLLAVLWFDLMFDVQGQSEAAVASTSAYYRRVTTDARPMNRLIAAFMVATLVGVVGEVVQGRGAPAWLSLGLAVAPIGLAGGRTVRNAVRLGRRADPLADQQRLARRILGDHVFCAISIGALLVLQVAWR
jgi:hypothetical protein